MREISTTVSQPASTFRGATVTFWRWTMAFGRVAMALRHAAGARGSAATAVCWGRTAGREEVVAARIIGPSLRAVFVHQTVVVLALLLIAATTGPTRAQSIEIIESPGLQLGNPRLSRDGSTIVGQRSPPFGAFRWTQATGLQSVPGMQYCNAVNADGTVVVGYEYFGATANAVV